MTEQTTPTAHDIRVAMLLDVERSALVARYGEEAVLKAEKFAVEEFELMMRGTGVGEPRGVLTR